MWMICDTRGMIDGSHVTKDISNIKQIWQKFGFAHCTYDIMTFLSKKVKNLLK